MADLTPGQTRALQYWGPIEAGTLKGENTQQIWQRIHNQAEALGYDKPGVTARDIAFLRSQAVESRTAREHLNRLGPDDLIDGQAFGTAPWARGLHEQNVLERVQVRFEHKIVTDGVESTVWRTSLFTGSMPRSKRELELALEGDAANMAAEYGVGNGGIGDYSIVRL